MMIFGIDKFMSECRALVNFCGNAVATLFIGRWTKTLDVDRARAVLNKEAVPELGDTPLRQPDLEAARTGHHRRRVRPAPLRPRARRPPSTDRPSPGPRRNPSTVERKGTTPVKVLVAPDKFKGSLTAAQVADRIAAGLEHHPSIQCTRLPLADGGDGSVAAAVAAGYQAHPVTVAGPTGQPHQAEIAFDGTTAVVEVANTCGITLLPGGRLEPLAASSHGFGQAVNAALALHPATVVLALGGSASTDGGLGLLTALGAAITDAGRTPRPAGRRAAGPGRPPRPHRPTDRGAVDRRQRRRRRPARPARRRPDLRTAEGRHPRPGRAS